jgi:hypothetical protein
MGFLVCECGSRTFEAEIDMGKSIVVVDNDGNVVAQAEEIDSTGAYYCSDCDREAQECEE